MSRDQWENRLKFELHKYKFIKQQLNSGIPNFFNMEILNWEQILESECDNYWNEPSYQQVQSNLYSNVFYWAWTLMTWTFGRNVCSLNDWKTAASFKAVNSVTLIAAGQLQATFSSMNQPSSHLVKKDAICSSQLLIRCWTAHSCELILHPASTL